MLDVRLLEYQKYLKTRHNSDSQTEIFDPVRKKWLKLQAEELVRQLFLQFCIVENICSANLISVEKEIVFNSMRRRYDIVLYSSVGSPWLLVECKSPDIELDQHVLDQAARYNLKLNVPYIIVTNGPQTHGFKIDFENQLFKPLKQFPIAPT